MSITAPEYKIYKTGAKIGPRTIFKRVTGGPCSHKEVGYIGNIKIVDTCYRQIYCLKCGQYRYEISLSQEEQSKISTIDKAIVYCLINPINNKPFYVGSSKNGEAITLKRHIACRSGRGVNAEKNEIIREILAKGKEPILKVLQRVHPDIQFDAERKWIRKYKSKFGVTNIAR